MKYLKSVLPGEIVRIADEDENLVTLKYYDKCARVLSAPDTIELLRAAEADAISEGKDNICFSFPSERSDISSEFEEEGYDIKNSTRIISVSARDLFASKGVMKSLGVTFSGFTYIPLRDLLLYQVEEMVELLHEQGIFLDANDIDRLDDDLSCIVYDDESRIKSLILVSTQGKEILIELLLGVIKNNPQYIMAAMQGFAKEFLSFRLLEVYDRISMLAANESIVPLIKRLLDKEYKVDESLSVAGADKSLKGAGKNEDIVFEKTNYSPFFKMPANYPYQENINWKMQWKQSDS